MSLNFFKHVQNIYIDKDSLKGAKEAAISSIDLFFNQKPSATNNKSNIKNPGATLFLVDVDYSRKPDISQIVVGNAYKNFARVEYHNIITSATASRKTTFRFESPIIIETNKEKSIVVVFDGNEDFVLWKNKKNDKLINTNVVSVGAFGPLVGDYYEDILINSTNLQNSETSPPWRKIADTSLKFSVNVARYFVNGTPVSLLPSNSTPVYKLSNNVTYTSNGALFKIESPNFEIFSYDKKNSRANISGGEKVYQEGVQWPNNSNSHQIGVVLNNISVIANSTISNGQPFNWNNIYSGDSENEYIVVVSKNDPSVGLTRTNIRKIVSIESNTIIQVDKPFTFTNANAKFLKTAIGEVDWIGKIKGFPKKYQGGIKKRVSQDMLILRHSNANSTVRFVNNQILSVNVVSSGVSYSNSDYVHLFGYENNQFVKGGYSAVANVVTNGSGAISSLVFTNYGAGFVNTGNVRIIVSNSATGSVSNNSSNTSNGSGLVLSYSTGALLRGEFNGGDGLGSYFSNVVVSNIEVAEVIINTKTRNSPGVKATSSFYNPYYTYVADNTYFGLAYLSNTSILNSKKLIKEKEKTFLDGKYNTVVASLSNQLVIPHDTTFNIPAVPYSGTGTVEVFVSSNNDFTAVSPGRTDLIYSRFSINNDSTNEHTDRGSADTRHITNKISFGEQRFAEDLIVYLTAYRPINTDIKVYARIHNSNDQEAFEDKNWTELELKAGDIFSSTSNKKDYIEMTFGPKKSPPVVINLSGSVDVSNLTTTDVVGSSTTFISNASYRLYPDDLIKIYSPLFSNNYAIAVVETVISDTLITLTNPIANSGIMGGGLKIDLIGRVGNSSIDPIGMPLQAFNNEINDNVLRYYSSSMVPFDTYNNMQLKVLLLSETANGTSVVVSTTTPRVDDIRAIGISS